MAKNQNVQKLTQNNYEEVQTMLKQNSRKMSTTKTSISLIVNIL